MVLPDSLFLRGTHFLAKLVKYIYRHNLDQVWFQFVVQRFCRKYEIYYLSLCLATLKFINLFVSAKRNTLKLFCFIFSSTDVILECTIDHWSLCSQAQNSWCGMVLSMAMNLGLRERQFANLLEGWVLLMVSFNFTEIRNISIKENY